jgi:hypothetical protein
MIFVLVLYRLVGHDGRRSGALVGLQCIDPRRYADSHPRAWSCMQLVAPQRGGTTNTMGRFIVGRQFLVSWWSLQSISWRRQPPLPATTHPQKIRAIRTVAGTTTALQVLRSKTFSCPRGLLLFCVPSYWVSSRRRSMRPIACWIFATIIFCS